MDELEKEFSGRVAVYQFDTALESTRVLQSQWDLRGHPSSAVIDSDGQLVQSFYGSYPKANFQRAMEAVAGE